MHKSCSMMHHGCHNLRNRILYFQTEFRMVYFWNSFLGNTIYEEEDCFNWTNCKDCGIYRWAKNLKSVKNTVFSTNVSIKEHKELLCPKRIQSCIYKSTGCPFKGPADTMMTHQASCQYRPGYNVVKCEFCGDPIHQPKFSKTKFENSKRCFNCRSPVFCPKRSQVGTPNWTLILNQTGIPIQSWNSDQKWKVVQFQLLFVPVTQIQFKTRPKMMTMKRIVMMRWPVREKNGKSWIIGQLFLRFIP